MCLVVQSCLTLCDCMESSPTGSSVNGNSVGKNTGGGSRSLLLDLPNPGTEPRSPALHVDSLPTNPPGKPLGKHTKKVEHFQIPVLAFQDVPVTFPAEQVYSASKSGRVRDFTLIARVRIWGRRRTEWTVPNFIHSLIPVLTNP